MKFSIQRRKWLIAGAALSLTGLTPFLAGAGRKATLQQQLASLEKQVKGRIGFALLNTDNGQLLDYRGGERFAMCSTFKMLAVSAILQRSQRQTDLLQKRVRWTSDEQIPYMPVTEKHQAEGMTIDALCAAALQYSDNLAANLLLNELGGPAGVTQFARTLGDNMTRLNRIEPALNSAIPGDRRDTTTPRHMVRNLHALALGTGLQPAQQQRLVALLKGNTTGKKAIRAGVPEEWTVGDKTGSGGYGTTNDVAVLWPVNGKPFVMSVYFTQHARTDKPRQDVLAQVARIGLAAALHIA